MTGEDTAESLVFLWLMFKNSVLTRDNLVKRNWKGKDKNYSFCDYPEMVDHLFCTCVVAKFVWGVVRNVTGIHDIPCKIEEFTAWVKKNPKNSRQTIAVGVSAVFWTLWKARNAATFHHVYPHDPSVLFFQISYWMSYRAGLQRKEGQQMLRAVATLLVDVANGFFNKSRGWAPMVKRLDIGE